jgi:hypothetical protein
LIQVAEINDFEFIVKSIKNQTLFRMDQIKNVPISQDVFAYLLNT